MYEYNFLKVLSMNQFSSLFRPFDRTFEHAIYPVLPTNIIEKPEGFVLSVKVPGIARKDVAVDIQGRTVKIVINTEKSPIAGEQERPRQAEAECHLVEFAVPLKAERIFEFREALDADAASLELNNGILTIVVGYQTRNSKRTLTLNE